MILGKGEVRMRGEKSVWGGSSSNEKKKNVKKEKKK